MSTLHWVESAIDVGWIDVNQSLPDMVLEIPAGGVLKKFLLSNVYAQGVLNGTGVFTVNTVSMEHQVTINGGALTGRRLFFTNRRIPMTAVGFHDMIALERPYTAWYVAGDHELGFNQECSYSNSDRFEWSIKLESFTFSVLTGFATNIHGRISRGFRALYSLP